jgi:hypothetical protein
MQQQLQQQSLSHAHTPRTPTPRTRSVAHHQSDESRHSMTSGQRQQQKQKQKATGGLIAAAGPPAQPAAAAAVAPFVPSSHTSIDVVDDEWQSHQLSASDWLPLHAIAGRSTKANAAAADADAGAAVSRPTSDPFAGVVARWEDPAPLSLLTPVSCVRSLTRAPGPGPPPSVGVRSASRSSCGSLGQFASANSTRSIDQAAVQRKRRCCCTGTRGKQGGLCARVVPCARRWFCSRWSFARLFSVLTAAVLCALVAVVWTEGVRSTVSIVHDMAATTRDALMETATTRVSRTAMLRPGRTVTDRHTRRRTAGACSLQVVSKMSQLRLVQHYSRYQIVLLCLLAVTGVSARNVLAGRWTRC